MTASTNPDNLTSAELWTILSWDERRSWAADGRAATPGDGERHWTTADISAADWKDLPAIVREDLVSYRGLGR